MILMNNQITKAMISSDREIIEKILAGEIALFELLIRRYNPVLYKIARSYGFNHYDAEDLMQETHFTAYTQLSKFEFKASYKTWISKILIHKCLYKLKYGYFNKEEINSDLVNEKTEPMHSGQKGQNTEKAVLTRELSKILENSLERLPEMYRTVFVLREIEGFSVAETAELLAITEVNVKVRLNRAKTMLQKQLEKFYSSADLYEFNLIYCDKIVHGVFERIKLMC